MIEQFAETFRAFLQQFFNASISVTFITRLIYSLILFFIIWLVRLIGVRFVNRRYHGDTRQLYNWRKFVEYATMAAGVILIGRIWLQGIDTIVTYLGLLSAGLAIALQDLIVAVAGWLFIVWRRPFVVGDRIQLGDHMGDVIDVRFFSFSLLEVGGRINAEQSTGRIIHVPNGKVFSEVLANTHQGLPFIWNEIPVMVTFESDWEKAKRILTNIINEQAPDVEEGMHRYRRRTDRFVIAYSNTQPAVYTSVADSGVVLTLRYLVDPRKKRGSEQDIWEAILRGFKPHWDIDLAYPTQREYLHFEEGKKPPDPQETTTIVAKKDWSKPYPRPKLPPEE